MKLARPDVFHPRIVLAGCPQFPDGDGDDAGLVAALRRRGLHARWLPWDDPRTELADLVILRAAWDYPGRHGEFLAWTKRVRNLLNAAPAVAWNSDKHYLADLAAAGVPVVPSMFFEPGDDVDSPAVQVVVKPAVGAGSLDARRFTGGDDAVRHAAALLAAGRGVVLQPYDARIEDGETALVFLGGQESHAFTKGPLLPRGGGAAAMDDSGSYAEERLNPADPDPDMWEIAHAALEAAASHLGVPREEFLYARVDLIGSGREATLLELELIEPSLGWRLLGEQARASGQRSFAVQVELACERLGLGPLAHRRP